MKTVNVNPSPSIIAEPVRAAHGLSPRARQIFAANIAPDEAGLAGLFGPFVVWSAVVLAAAVTAAAFVVPMLEAFAIGLWGTAILLVVLHLWSRWSAGWRTVTAARRMRFVQGVAGIRRVEELDGTQTPRLTIGSFALGQMDGQALAEGADDATRATYLAWRQGSPRFAVGLVPTGTDLGFRPEQVVAIYAEMPPGGWRS